MVPFKNILVPVDFGEPSRRALEIALGIAERQGSTLTLIHTWEIPVYGYGALGSTAMDLLTPIEGAARQQLEALLADVRKVRSDTTALLACGVPWREILATIEKTKPDLVVMGTHGRRGIGHAILGSVAEKIVRMSPSPVLTVRAEAA